MSAQPANISNAVELPNSVHQLPTGSKALRRTSEQRWIELTVGVRRSQQLPDLSSLDDKLPGARTYMTRDQLASQYGADEKSVAAIEAFAKANNLVVTHKETVSARMGLAGTVADVSKALGVTLFDYSHPKLGDFHARTGPVHVPPEVADAITGVFGLNNHRVLRRTLQSHTVAASAANAARAWFIPTELADIYNFPAGNAQQQCIGLLEFGGGVDIGDLTSYFQTIQQPAPDVQIVAVDGVSTDPGSDPNSPGEVMLDVDVAAALANGAKIVAYFATFNQKGLADVLAKVVSESANDPSVISLSWGWDEN